MKCKKIVLVLLAVVLLLSGCESYFRAYTLGEVIPDAIDAASGDAQIESLSIVRADDGAAVVLSGVDVETFLLHFENISCIREKGKGIGAEYRVSFRMTNASNQPNDMVFGDLNGTTAGWVEIGKYRYSPVNGRIDILYLKKLFP